MLETAPVTDGDYEYSFEEPGEDRVEYPPPHTRDKDTGSTLEKDDITCREEITFFVFESAEFAKHDGDCSTPATVIHLRAYAHLMLKGLCSVR
jgi:hypothetical protein